MKVSVWVLAIFLLLALSSCGDSDAREDERSRKERSQKASRSDTPEIAAPPGPRKKLVVRDLEVGSGPPTRRGDLVEVYYVADESETGEPLYHRWPPASPLDYRIGSATWGRGWQEGIEGMRVGGRRELLMPVRYALDNFPIDYVIEVASIKRRGDRSKVSQ